MEYCFIPSNLKMGADSCVVKVLGASHKIIVRWCAEKDYPNKLTDVTSEHTLKINKNGTYVVEFTAGSKKTLKKFSVCHLRPMCGFAGGNGSPESPYLISNCAQFTGIRSNLQAHYRLIADLHFEREMKNLCWLPIGKYSRKEPKLDLTIPLEDQDLSYITDYGFTGELDGGGHTIFGLTCKHPDMKSVGIFGSCGDGVYIHNISLVNCYFGTNRSTVAGTIAARAEDALIEKCSIKKTSVNATLIGGGVVGEAEPGTTFRACQFNGKLTGDKITKTSSSLGGIVGHTYQDLRRNTHIEDCCVKAELRSGVICGGIMTGAAIVSRCFFCGTVEGVRYCAGIAASGANTLVQNCVCVNAEIYHTGETPFSVRGPSFITSYSEDGNQDGPDFIEDAWKNTAGRIMCDDYTLSPTEKRCINYGASSCKLRTKSVEYPVIDGSLRDGITILEEAVHDPNFYIGLGWNFDTVWTFGKDGLPQIR